MVVIVYSIVDDFKILWGLLKLCLYRRIMMRFYFVVCDYILEFIVLYFCRLIMFCLDDEVVNFS